MPGLVIRAPRLFDDPDLPVLPTVQVPSIKGAMVDLAANALPAASSISTWWDRVAGIGISAPSVSQRPTVIDDPTYGHLLRFDGANDRLDVTGLALPEKITVVAVLRFRGVTKSQYAIVGIDSPLHTYVNGAGNFAFQCGTSGIDSGVPQDTNLHVVIGTVDGASSAVRVDGTEETGTLGGVATTNLRFGATSSAYTKTDIARYAILPYAASPTERAAIAQTLMRHYGIAS